MKRHVLLGIGTLAVLFALALPACKPEPDPPPGLGGSVLPPGLHTPDGTPVPGVTGLTGALDWIKDNGAAGGEYTIVLDEAVTETEPRILESGGGNVTIVLQGYGAARAVSLVWVISLTRPGSLFTINSGVTLVLGENIILRGREDNNAPLVVIKSGAALTINNGAKITGNTHNGGSNDALGGGVLIEGGTLTMNGGEISGNRAVTSVPGKFAIGGGVFLGEGSTVRMSGGEISGNAITAAGWAGGGGVAIDKGALYMSGGKISGNAIASSGADAGGGGINNVNNGSITMTGGEISGNTVTAAGWAGGGGIHLEGMLNMSGGKISGNAIVSLSADGAGGGGISDVKNGSITMSGGEISGNTVRAVNWAGGGGIFLEGILNMVGGKISGNAVASSGADAGGGGIGNVKNGSVTMSGGEISGNTVTAAGWADGGGIHLDGMLNMFGGKIFENAVVSSSYRAGGGGIWLGDNDMAAISGGEIFRNTVRAVGWAGGGGVFISGDAGFIMISGGVISGNTVTCSTANEAQGGGLFIGAATFRKISLSGSANSGTIYGNDAGANSNRVIDPSGEIFGGSHAVGMDGGRGLAPIHITVGPDHHLNTSVLATFHN